MKTSGPSIESGMTTYAETQRAGLYNPKAARHIKPRGHHQKRKRKRRY